MTGARGARPAAAADQAPVDEPLLLVAVCGGQRCCALRDLHDERSPGPGSESLIRDAVRSTRRSMMLSTGCLGPCAQGAVVAVGQATLAGSHAVWLAPPLYWGSTETDRHATELARWIGTAARLPGTAPSPHSG